jgi:ectoine hydroxylase-related dioxygenase (phytanoyl-CoA dioxygenase family)
VLTDDQRCEFERVGVVRLPGAFSDTDARRMRDRVWDLLAKKHGIDPDEPATWTIRQPTGFQALTRSRAFDPLASPVLTNALDQVLGQGAWGMPKQWGAPLVTFPDHSSEWDVPAGQWHLDFAARGPHRPLPGIRILAFLVPVAPRGGGTLVLTGSHILVERLVASGSAGRGHSTEVRESLSRREPWLRDLWCKGKHDGRIQRFMVEGCVLDGVAVRVVELTGEPGDLFLMHPWAFHAPSPNCGSTPRMMVSHSVFRRV